MLGYALFSALKPASEKICFPLDCAVEPDDAFFFSRLYGATWPGAPTVPLPCRPPNTAPPVESCAWAYARDHTVLVQCHPITTSLAASSLTATAQSGRVRGNLVSDPRRRCGPAPMSQSAFGRWFLIRNGLKLGTSVRVFTSICFDGDSYIQL